MKRLFIGLIFALSISIPQLSIAQETVEDSGFGEVKLRQMFCSSLKQNWACRYLSEGLDCPLTHTTSC